MKKVLIDFGKHVFLVPVIGTAGALGIGLWGLWRLVWALIEGFILLGWFFYTAFGFIMVLFGAGSVLHVLAVFCYFGGAYILARMARYALGYPVRLFVHGLPDAGARPVAAVTIDSAR